MIYPPSNAAGEKTPWGDVLLFVGVGVVTAFQVGKAPPMLPAIRAEFGISLFLAGWILSIFTTIGLVLGPVAGVIADAFGHRRLLLWGLVFQAAGSLIGAWSPGAAVLLATRIIEGIGFFIVVVAAPALVFRITQPRDLRIALSAWSCFLPAGAAIIMLFAPMLTHRFGWRGLWLVNAVVLVIYCIWLVRSTAHLKDRPNRQMVSLRRLSQNVRQTATSAGPILLALIFSTYTVQWLALMGFLPTLLIEDQGVSAGRASVLTAIMVAINVPGNLAGGWLLHKGFRRWRLIAATSLIMGACSFVIYSPALPFLLRYIACLLFSGVGGLVPASVLGGAPIYAPKPELVATTNGLIMQGSQLGQTLGPPALALIVSKTGDWQSAPWLLATSAVAGIMLSLGLAVLERKREALGI